MLNRTITFITPDGVNIVADYLQGKKEAPTALLLHMMPATRTSWHPFMEKLREVGFSSLAIDFRGHGESIKKFQISNFKFQIALPTSSRVNPSRVKNRGILSNNNYKTLDYKKFTDAEQQEKILDVRAAVQWLEKNKGAHKDALVLVGASIGANLTLQYLAENPEVKKGVLLSPGLNYRGVKTDLLIKRLHPGQRVLLLASSDDTHGSFLCIRELNRLNPTQTEKHEFSNLGHGTTMFEHRPELMDRVIDFLLQ